jgi:fatty-acyl-CoA synthase
MPKGVMYSHELVLASLAAQGERSELSPEDRMLIVAPFFHGLGHMAGPPLGIAFGASIAPQEIFNAETALQKIERHRCTTLFAVPTMFQLMLEHPDFEHRDLSSLRVGLITAAPSPLGLKREIVEKIPSMALLTGYGSTETGGGCTFSKIGDPPGVIEETIGFPLRTYEVKIFDPATGKELPPHTPGELCTRGPCIMMGYYGEEKNTEVIDRDGWFHTGDLAEYDDDGYLKIVGRIKDMIITGGNNVYPAEVADILEEHPAVKEAQVIGVPDPLKSEVVMAYVILKEDMTCTPEELQDFCRQRTSNYKVPRYVHFIDTFPVSGAGKVMKGPLKKRAIEELGFDGQ